MAFARTRAGAFFFARRETHYQGVPINEARINERIRVPEVRLVGPAGEQVGIVRVEDALRLAQEADLDLVEVAPNERPPVAKLMDFGKFKYEANLKAREARRNQAHTEVKEMRFRLKIDDHDYETKKGHIIRFLKAGDKVKVTIMFRGREQSRPEMGRRLLQRLAEDVAELSVVENAPTQEGRNMSLVLGPLKKKAEAQAEARKEREARKVGEATAADKSAAPHGEATAKRKSAEDIVAEAANPEIGKSASSRPAGKRRAAASAKATSAAHAKADSDPEATDAAPAEAKQEAKPVAKPAAKKTAAAKPAAAKAATAKPAAKKTAAKPAAKKAPAKATTKDTKTSGS